VQSDKVPATAAPDGRAGRDGILRHSWSSRSGTSVVHPGSNASPCMRFPKTRASY